MSVMGLIEELDLAVGLPAALSAADTPSNDVNIGVYAFAAFFILALTLWLLMRNMNARMRRMSYRHKAEDAAAERAADGRPTGGEPDGESGDEPGQAVRE